MVVQYPYSLSLRYLLAMKSQQEDNTDLGRNIEMLATYGIDRAHLHKIFSEDPIVLEDLEETIIMGEDYLELKELSALEREIEGDLVENKISSISFLEESTTSAIANQIETTTEESVDVTDTLPIHETVDDINKIPSEALISDEPELEEVAPTEATGIGKVIGTSALIGGASFIKSKDLSEAPALSEPTIESPLKDESDTIENSPEIEEDKEDFIIMDFEEDSLEEIGTADSSDELAPSESFSLQEIEFDENGLPADAVEINDNYQELKGVQDPQINDLFKEAEAEILAEEAVSDSKAYIDNPEALLIEESEKVISSATILEAMSNNKKTDAENEALENKLDVSENLANTAKPRPQIPFEISYSELDPIANENVTPPETETSKTASLDKMEELSKETQAQPIMEEPKKSQVLPQPKKTRVPVESFTFDSLDQFEAKLIKDKLKPFTTPVPKSGFNSWQQQYSGVESLSGVNLVPLEKSTGKVIKKRKKIVRKQFEKTVAFAEESLTMTEGIASETLAQLLVKQGQYSQARAMYKELCLIMPKKSSFFAGEIEKIQNLPDEPS